MCPSRAGAEAPDTPFGALGLNVQDGNATAGMATDYGNIGLDSRGRPTGSIAAGPLGLGIHDGQLSGQTSIGPINMDYTDGQFGGGMTLGGSNVSYGNGSWGGTVEGNAVEQALGGAGVDTSGFEITDATYNANTGWNGAFSNEFGTWNQNGQYSTTVIPDDGDQSTTWPAVQEVATGVKTTVSDIWTSIFGGEKPAEQPQEVVVTEGTTPNNGDPATEAPADGEQQTDPNAGFNMKGPPLANWAAAWDKYDKAVAMSPEWKDKLAALDALKQGDQFQLGQLTYVKRSDGRVVAKGDGKFYAIDVTRNKTIKQTAFAEEELKNILGDGMGLPQVKFFGPGGQTAGSHLVRGKTFTSEHAGALTKAEIAVFANAPNGTVFNIAGADYEKYDGTLQRLLWNPERLDVVSFAAKADGSGYMREEQMTNTMPPRPSYDRFNLADVKYWTADGVVVDKNGKRVPREPMVIGGGSGGFSAEELTLVKDAALGSIFTIGGTQYKKREDGLLQAFDGHNMILGTFGPPVPEKGQGILLKQTFLTPSGGVVNGSTGRPLIKYWDQQGLQYGLNDSGQMVKFATQEQFPLPAGILPQYGAVLENQRDNPDVPGPVGGRVDLKGGLAGHSQCGGTAATNALQSLGLAVAPQELFGLMKRKLINPGQPDQDTADALGLSLPMAKGLVNAKSDPTYYQTIFAAAYLLGSEKKKMRKLDVDGGFYQTPDGVQPGLADLAYGVPRKGGVWPQATTDAEYKQRFMALRTALPPGTSVVLGGKQTDAGHYTRLAGIDETGVTVMDPYGFHKFGRNAKGEKTLGGHVPMSDTDNKGMLQHYTWDEVRLLDLGFNIQIFQEER